MQVVPTRPRVVGSMDGARAGLWPTVQVLRDLADGNGLVHPDFCLTRRKVVLFRGTMQLA